MSKRPWMPLYIADYLAKTAHLTVTEHGAYLLLIMNYWHNDGLPDDEAKIARIARMSAKQWAQSRDTLKGFFEESWKHKRIDEEIAQAIEISRKRSASARQKHSKPEAKADTLHTPQPIAKAIGADKKSRKGNKTPIPEGLTLDSEWIAEGKKRGISEENIRREFQKFCSRAKRDDARYVNWSQAWSNWLDNAIGYNPKLVTMGSATVVSIEDEQRVWETLLEKYQRTGSWPSQRIPAPGTAGCPIPPELIAKYQTQGASV
jgi:uncharacterized protein YdaU (DUF1376 family)